VELTGSGMAETGKAQALRALDQIRYLLRRCGL
jgi:hypothetical protein